MASLSQVIAIGQCADKKLTVTLQRAATRHSSTAQQEQTHNSKSAPNCANTGHSTFQCKAPVCRHVVGCTANAETSDSDARRGSYYQHEHLEGVKVWDARRSTFNEIGRDQYNQHNSYVVHHHHTHFYPRGTLDDLDPEINAQIVSEDCKLTRIESTTTFRTTNVSVVAPYFADLGIPDSDSEDLILTVKRTSVRYTFFSDPA